MTFAQVWVGCKIMVMDRRIYSTDHVVGIIKIVPSESEFPWSIFTDGKINCAYTFSIEDYPINDIRIWLDENATKTVFLYFSRWSPCKFAFTNPDDAIKFSMKFGDVLKRMT